MIKKNVLLSVATITMMCFIFACCAGGSDNDANEDTDKKEKTEEKSEEATETSTKEMTEDLYVEIVAQQMYLVAKYEKKADDDISDVEAMKLSREMSEKLNKLYQEYKVSQDDFERFADEIMEDMETYGAIMNRINERVEELIAEDEE
ncbi:MAG: hypothetical protein ACP5DZ_08015 [Bacteroidales bacterium]